MIGEQSIWTIWIDRPEHPRKHVVRRHEIPIKSPKPLDEHVADSLEEARAHLPPGVVKAARNEREDPALVELWAFDPRDTSH